MGEIRNTTEDMQDPAEQMLLLAVGMANRGDPSEYIEAQERSGQSQLVNSDRLPTQVHDEGGDAPYLALGFTFGPPDPGDPLFRPATLPPGWSRRASDHPMGSSIVDQHGRERVSVFYKAAFYDRKADMNLVSHYGYLSSALYHDRPVVLDDEWLPLDVALAELERMAAKCEERAAEADRFATAREDDYWPARAAEHRGEAAKARALAKSLTRSAP